MTKCLFYYATLRLKNKVLTDVNLSLEGILTNLFNQLNSIKTNGDNTLNERVNIY